MDLPVNWSLYNLFLLNIVFNRYSIDNIKFYYIVVYFSLMFITPRHAQYPYYVFTITLVSNHLIGLVNIIIFFSKVK